MPDIPLISTTPGSATTAPAAATNTINPTVVSINALNDSTIPGLNTSIAATNTNVAANSAAITSLQLSLGATPSSLTLAQLTTQYTSSNIVGYPQYVTADCGLWWWNGRRWIMPAPVVLAQTAIPFVLCSSGSMAANGALTLTTALDRIISNCYMYFPAGALYTSSLFGWYFVQMSSTTLGTVFANMYFGGQPSIPAAPVGIIATGPGAYTQVTAAPGISSLIIPLPANVMGLSNELTLEYGFTCFNSATNKRLTPVISATAVAPAFVVTTTGLTNTVFHSIRNAGVANQQTVMNQSTGEPGAGINFLPLTIDTTVGQYISINLQLDTAATDWMYLQSATIKVTPSSLLDYPAAPAVIPSGPTVIPPGAAALGYTVNKFFINPTVANIDFTETANGPLFARLYYQTMATSTTGFNPSSGFAQNVGGQLQLQQGGVITGSPTFGTQQLPLLSAAAGFYAEWATHASINNFANFQACWMLPIEHGSVPTTTYVEIDVDEPGFVRDANNSTFGMRSNVIHWVSGVATNNILNTGIPLDRTIEHILGVSYDPVGMLLTFYCDGVAQYLKSTAAFNADMATFHYYMICGWQSHLGTGAYTFTAPPSGIGATLSAPWASNTDQYAVFFSTGEYRIANFTRGSTAVTWTNVLSTAPTASFTASLQPFIFNIRYLSAWSSV